MIQTLPCKVTIVGEELEAVYKLKYFGSVFQQGKVTEEFSE